MRQKSSVAEHLHNLSPYFLRSMMEVSSEAWHAILDLVTVTPWQYPRGLACDSLSDHPMAVSAEAWHVILQTH